MKKKMLLLAVFALLLTVLTGCGKPDTPEEIWEAYLKAAKGVPCTQMEMTLEMGMNMNMDVMDTTQTMRMDVELTGTTTSTQDPIAGKVDMTMNMRYSLPELDVNEQMDMDLQAYTVMEDGELVSYTYTMDTWVRQKTGVNPENLIKTADTILDGANLTFQKDETVQEWEGKPAVCLTTTITGDAMQTMMDSLMQGMGEELMELMGDVDLSALGCDMRLYIDTETYLPLAQELTITGMDQAISGMMEGTGVEMEIDTYTAAVRYLSFDPQPSITVPEEVKANAIDMDGLYDEAA